MSASQTQMPAALAHGSVGAWPKMLTWRSPERDRIETVRVQLNGGRIRAYGRIVSAVPNGDNAFSASYDVITDDSGVTKRLAIDFLTAEGQRQVTITRDAESVWMIRDDNSDDVVRGSFNDAHDVDLAPSPFFNALAIRRRALAENAVGTCADVPVVYVRLPEGEIEPAHVRYETVANGIRVVSPVSDATVTVDRDGFIMDYPDLAQRV